MPVIDEALDVLQQNPDFALHIATLACARLNATSALLVDLRHAAAGKKQEQALMSRILAAMLATPKVTGGRRSGRITSRVCRAPVGPLTVEG